ncbi:hypothetical protein ACTXT7_003746 [Hymenolepis weldensis]
MISMPRIELRGALDETYYENLGEESEKEINSKCHRAKIRKIQKNKNIRFREFVSTIPIQADSEPSFS